MIQICESYRAQSGKVKNKINKLCILAFSFVVNDSDVETIAYKNEYYNIKFSALYHS